MFSSLCPAVPLGRRRMCVLSKAEGFEMEQRQSFGDLIVAPTGFISMCKHGMREANGISTSKMAEY